MEQAAKESLARRVARLRMVVRQASARSAEAQAGARETATATAAARRARWSARYQHVFERKARELDDLKLGD